MIDHKAAKKFAEQTPEESPHDNLADAYLDLRRLVKEYFDVVDSDDASWIDYDKAAMALRAAIGEE